MVKISGIELFARLPKVPQLRFNKIKIVENIILIGITYTLKSYVFINKKFQHNNLNANRLFTLRIVIVYLMSTVKHEFAYPSGRLDLKKLRWRCFR